MSSFSGSMGVVAGWLTPRGVTPQPTTPGQQQGSRPGSPNAAPRLGSAFSTAFSRNLGDVLARGASGEFDDPSLRLQEQAALSRLAEATRRARETSAAVTGGGAVPPSSAPTVTGAPSATVSPGAGGAGANAAPSTGANAAPTLAPTGPSPIADQRELLAVRVRQGEARLANISSSLRADFPKAAAMESASSGSWDPATFTPSSAEEAEVFAQRMVIDATEAAARLEVVTTQLDSARLEVAATGSPASASLVRQLEADARRQRAYVDKLATIVDRASGGGVSEAGQAAVGGASLRRAGDLPVEEFARGLRNAGMAEEQVVRVIGASELAVEQEQAPPGSGGSTRLQRISHAAAASMVAAFHGRLERSRSEFRAEQAERQREYRRADERADERARTEEVAAERAARREAEFAAWVAALAAAERDRRATG